MQAAGPYRNPGGQKMQDLIGLIGATITLAKGIQEISQNINNAALFKQISDLYFQLAQVQTEAAEMTAEIRNLKADIEERDNNPLRYSGFVYLDNKGDSFCPACYDDRKKRIHLKILRQGDYRCPVCNTYFP
jgi:hypothetical protein